MNTKLAIHNDVAMWEQRKTYRRELLLQGLELSKKLVTAEFAKFVSLNHFCPYLRVQEPVGECQYKAGEKDVNKLTNNHILHT